MQKMIGIATVLNVVSMKGKMCMKSGLPVTYVVIGGIFTALTLIGQQKNLLTPVDFASTVGNEPNIFISRSLCTLYSHCCVIMYASVDYCSYMYTENFSCYLKFEISVQVRMSASGSSTVTVLTVVRGYRVHQSIWAPTIGEEFVSFHQNSNIHDSHAMGVCWSPANEFAVIPRRSRGITGNELVIQGTYTTLLSGVSNLYYTAPAQNL